jgi:NitT/TauT family transport system substrate-binding protein
MQFHRRDLLLTPAALALTTAATAFAAPVTPATPPESLTQSTGKAPEKPLDTLRLLLNSGPSGANAWFFVAEERGFFRDEGLDVTFSPGRGAYTAAPRLFAEGFDMAYGDINALTEVAASNPGRAPIGVYMMFNATPAVIGVDAKGPITSAKDLPNRRLSAHPTDVALGIWPAFAAANGLNPHAIRLKPSDDSMQKLISAMLAGKTDGVFGYFTTQTAGAMSANLNPTTALRFLRFDESLPDFYGSAVMASQNLVTERPGLVARAIAAINAGVVATISDPEAAIDIVMKRAPDARRNVEMTRLQGTLAREMAHPEGKTIGIGDADDARLTRSIAQLSKAKALPTTPPLRAVFRRDFLPPLGERPVRV